MFQLDISNCLDQHPITIPVCTDLDVDSPLDTLLIPNHVSVWINSTRVADHLSSLCVRSIINRAGNEGPRIFYSHREGPTMT